MVDGGSGYLPALVRTLGAAVAVTDPASAAAGAPGNGAFTLLLIDGAIEQLPAGLAGSLADEGRVATGTVERGVTRLAVGRKVGGDVALLPIAEMGIPVLPAFARPKGWSF